MKYVVVSRLAPGVENARKSLEVFMKAPPQAPPGGSIEILAAIDGKTVITIVESDDTDMALTYTFAPYWEETKVFPVVAIDEAWMQAIEAAQANWA
jgi:hypothetical protein